MSKHKKDYLIPSSIVLINGVLGYLTNNLPSIQPDPEKGITGLSDTLIFVFTAISVVALCILTFLENNSPQNSIQNDISSEYQNVKSNSIGGFLLFLVGAVIYGLIQLNIIPEQFRNEFGYISLILCGFGAIIPSFLLIPKWWQNILLLLCSVIGVFLTFHYLNVANLNALSITLFVLLFSIILLIARDFLVEVIKTIALFWENLQNRQATEISKIITNKLENLVSPFERNYYKALEYKCQYVEKQYLDNEFALELQKVFVTLKIASNNASNTKQDIIPKSQNKSLPEVTIWDCLSAQNEKGRSLYKRLVILGRPGSGKTTLLRHLTLIYATKQQHNIQLKDNRRVPELIPVLLYLREIHDKIIRKNPSLETLIQQEIENLKINNKNLNPPSNWVNNKLQRNQFLIMLDGLDEVADKNQRQQVRTWVDSQIQNYQDTVFILTSRPNGYRQVQSHVAVDELEVQPFNREQITNFLQQWYLQTEIKRRPEQYYDAVKQVAEEKANNLIERIVNSRPLVTMAVNPLLLQMIATVHSHNNTLPGKRVELYKQICQILLEKRQQAKKIHDVLTASQKQTVLQILALKLMQNETREFTLAEAENWIHGQLKTLPKLNNAEEFIKHIRDICSLLIEKEVGEYEFAHLSFQEYLAAVEISESNQQDILIQNIDKTWWSETIRLYAAQAKDATNIVNAVINMPSPSINAFLVIADYEDEGWRIDKQVREELENKLDTALESDEPEIFKLAAEVKIERRLNKLVRINEELEIDNDYITPAEYKLFLLETGYKKIPQNWQNQNFPKGTAKNKVDGITLEDANQFCCWLSLRDFTNQLNEQLVTWYRLPTPKERKQYQMGETNFDEITGIRLVRYKLPLKYKQLAEYLMKGKWEEADKKTLTVMLEVSNRNYPIYRYSNNVVEAIGNFPCKHLRIIDTLWISASNGKFGFSVQKDIYQSLGGKREYSERVCIEFCNRIGWRRNGNWLIEYDDMTISLNAQDGLLPASIIFSGVSDWIFIDAPSTIESIYRMKPGSVKIKEKVEEYGIYYKTFSHKERNSLISSLLKKLMDCNI